MAQHDPHGGAAPDKPPAYETRDVNFWVAVWFIVILLLLAVAGFLVIIPFDEMWNRGAQERDAAQQELTPLSGGRVVPPGPLLQPDPPADMQTYLESQQEKLNGFGWVSEVEQTVHVPIDLAIEHALRDGLPEWPPVEGFAVPGPETALPSDSPASPIAAPETPMALERNRAVEE